MVERGIVQRCNGGVVWSVHGKQLARACPVTIMSSQEKVSDMKHVAIILVLVVFCIIPVVASPTAYFIPSQPSGNAPLAIRFEDMSNGATEWRWDFGDGSTQILRGSSSGTISHTYQSAGNYQCTLVIQTGARHTVDISVLSALPTTAPTTIPVVIEVTPTPPCGNETAPVYPTATETTVVTQTTIIVTTEPTPEPPTIQPHVQEQEQQEPLQSEPIAEPTPEPFAEPASLSVPVDTTPNTLVMNFPNLPYTGTSSVYFDFSIAGVRYIIRRA